MIKENKPLLFLENHDVHINRPYQFPFKSSAENHCAVTKFKKRWTKPGLRAFISSPIN